MRSVVGVGDWRVSANPQETIITYALGSCLGIVVYDPALQIAGLLHTMLPFSGKDPEKAKIKPAMFVDSGFSVLLRDFYELGAEKSRIKIIVAGGASMKTSSNDDYFKIGARNFTTLRKLLWKNGYMIDFQDVGGSISRTMSVQLSDGLVLINKKPVEINKAQSLANKLNL
ncbi:MAG: chemotaxis protein CheD [Balneolia bacterium]|nr:chemotaxis protein CheD [Balneolia bacterium]